MTDANAEPGDGMVRIETPNAVDVGTGSFGWNAGTRTFTASASDLRLPPGGWPARLRLRSAATGRAVTFGERSFDRDADGDVRGVAYYSVDLPGVAVLVYNT